MHLEQYDRIRDGIASGGFTPELETRITLFLCACKAVNIPFLSMASMAPATTLAWQAANSQLFRESESMTLLMRVTRWAVDPFTYIQSSQLTAPVYTECASTGFSGWPMSVESASFEALAFGHALLATVRMTPVIPAGGVAESPYAVALMRIEQENGRLLQTQIRMMKDGFAGLDTGAREEIIARKVAAVEGAFDAFLTALAV